MGGLPAEHDFHRTEGQTTVIWSGPRRGVQHQAGIQAGKLAGFQQANLARRLIRELLGGCAYHDHLSAHLVQRGGGPDGGPNCASRDQVVPTAMPDVRQRIVFGQEGHRRPGPARIARGPEGCRQATDGPLHRESLPFQVFGQTSRSQVFFPAQLRVFLDIEAYLAQHVRLVVDSPGSQRFQRVDSFLVPGHPLISPLPAPPGGRAPVCVDHSVHRWCSSPTRARRPAWPAMPARAAWHRPRRASASADRRRQDR